MYHKNLVFFAACFGMLLFGIVFLSLGSVNNMLAEKFHLDDNRIGTLTALLPFGILIASLIFGPIVDRFGYKWMLVICSLLVLVALEGVALAHSLLAVQFFVFLIGFGGGVLNGATNALVADVSEGERGAKLCLLGVFFGLGALGMPGTLAVLSKHFSHTSIVAGIGLFVILPVLYFLLISFPPPKQQGQKFSLTESLVLLKEPILLLAGITLAFQSGMEGMSNDWMTRFFKKVILVGDLDARLTERHSLWALTTLVAVMVVTRLALGALLKKAQSQLVLFASIVSAAAGALVLTTAPAYPVALAGVVLIGAGLSAAFPVILGYIGDLFPARSGTAFSTVFVVALIGNMTINKTLGLIAKTYGIQQYTKVMLLCLVCSAALIFLIVKQLNKTNPQILKSK